MADRGRVRPPGPRSLDVALTQLGGVVVASVAVVCALLVGSPNGPLWILLLFPAVAVTYAVAGMVAWVRRPTNRLGPVMMVGSLAWIAASLGNTQVPALIAVGTVTATVPLAVVVHLLHAFPTGRLATSVSRVTVVAVYLVTTVLQAPKYLFTASPAPGHLLAVADRPDLAALGANIQSAAAALCVLVTAGVLVQRVRRSTVAQRRVLAPLLVYGMLAVLFVPFSAQVLERMLGVDPVTRAVLQLVVLAGVPVAFVFGVLRGGFRRTGQLDELSAWLGAAAESRAAVVEQALAGTLGDPSAQVVYSGPEPSGYLDAAGREVRPPAPGSDRAMIDIELGDRRVGAIVYDAGVIEDVEFVRQAGRVIALVVDRERLTAEVLAASLELRRSRERIVAATDTERRRIARDLHDGLQMKLVVLALDAHAVGHDETASPPVRAQAERLRAGIDAAAEELRGLVHGVMPALLIERGLYAATEDLVDRLPIATVLEMAGDDDGLSETVQSAAYFAISEALTNAVKHSGAQQLQVNLERVADRLRIEVADDGVGGAGVGAGAGLRGLADRLDVMRGTLRVDSPPHRGTRVEVSLPCGS